jgi:hypothetical protein
VDAPPQPASPKREWFAGLGNDLFSAPPPTSSGTSKPSRGGEDRGDRQQMGGINRGAHRTKDEEVE